jgi:AraC-like DNA-binding protein
MIKIGQLAMQREILMQPIQGVRYFNRRFPKLGIEPLALSELFRRVPPDHLDHPQRPAFHLLMLFSSGTTTHFLDFERFRCTAGTLLHVRPGQVQQFVPGAEVEATVVLFTPEFVLPDEAANHPLVRGSALDHAAARGAINLDADSYGRVCAGFAAVIDEYKRSDGSTTCANILQHQLHVLLLQIARCSDRHEAPLLSSHHRTFRHFLTEVEAHFMRTRRVEDYADRLGCSTKALRRACLAVRGLPPKMMIEERVILEAKRLIAYTLWPIKVIAETVGFGEATNFVKSFCHHAGMTPSQFRTRFPGRSRPESRSYETGT